MVQVREMSAEDLEFAVRLTDTMGWGFVEDDFKFMMQLEPHGCFVMLHNSERIGLVTTVNFGSVGWFGNFIVDEKYRAKGFGTALAKHAIEYLKSNKVETVGLYAYLGKVPFYKRLGFEYDSGFVVLTGKGSPSKVRASLKTAEKSDVGAIVDCDSSCFGASRKKLLGPLLLDADNLWRLAAEDDEMIGYLAAKVYEEAKVAEIGPAVSVQGRNDVAISLLKTALDRLDGFEVSACVPKKESPIINALKSLGFIESFSVARMFLGRPIIRECIYMAESLERG